MSLEPINQVKLFELGNDLINLVKLFETNKLPNKILLSGRKGIGKSTLAYHLINYILSKNEIKSYNLNKFEIDPENISFKLINNKTSLNFKLLDLEIDKKNINIDQIRNLINELNKSSFNSKPRIVLIDNIEFLNINSINALLKILEEPNDNIFFILINNNKKILPTLRSRCLDFKITLSNFESMNIINNLLEDNVRNFINEEFMNYYFSPGNIYKLCLFAKKNNIDLKNENLKNFLNIIIKDKVIKKEANINFLFFELIEYYIRSQVSLIKNDYSNYFLKKIDEVKNYSLDEESFFIEFENKVLNG